MSAMDTSSSEYQYDLVVLGGGSGGLAASKEATKQNPNAKVAVFDYVTPTNHGTKWGLGGTCVNVGCIPKKLFHFSSLLGRYQIDAQTLGWTSSGEHKHDWATMQRNVGGYIRQLNFGYKKALKDANVEYINALAKFVDPHTISYVGNDGKEQTCTADKVIIAVGGRPWVPDVPGAELGITSDDIFWWKKNPGKVLTIGAGYISLECAGFLHEQGHDVTVAVRSIILRPFDRQVAEQIGETMERSGVKFLLPVNIKSLAKPDGDDGQIEVTFIDGKTKEEFSEKYDTVIWAVGRYALLKEINADGIGLEMKKGKLIVDDNEQTNIDNIYGIGDVLFGKPELTPVAIQAGQLLAKRLFGNGTTQMDYINVPTTVFTPLEYGVVGLTQEEAEAKYANLNVYCSRFGALETAVTYHDEIPELRSTCFTAENLWYGKFMQSQGEEWKQYKPSSYEFEERCRKFLNQPLLAKLVCDADDNDKVVGFHYLGPNAGEITQGYCLAIRAGVTKSDFDSMVGIHPTTAEEFTTLSANIKEGEDFLKKGGC